MTTATESIKSQILELQRQREEIEAAEFTEQELPRIMALLGKSYVYRNNSYSCPERPSDYWDVFRKVVRVVPRDGAAWLLFEECSIDKNGKPSLSVEASLTRRADWGQGWKSCTAKEYESNRRRVSTEIISPDLYVAGFNVD